MKLSNSRFLSSLAFLAVLGSPALAWATDLTTELVLPDSAVPGQEVPVSMVVTANQVQGENVQALVLLTGAASFLEVPQGCTAGGPPGAFMCDLGTVPADTSVSIDGTLLIADDAAIGSEVEVECNPTASNEVNPANNAAYGTFVIEAIPSGCVDDLDCPDGFMCEEGECVELIVDEPEECDPACGEGEYCDLGQCIDETSGEVVSGEPHDPGCSIATNGARGTALLGPLALAFLALRRRRGRSSRAGS